MPDTYLALLRGVNVGGRARLPMADLRAALGADGLGDVRTYLQSGNVVFTSDAEDPDHLAAAISATIAADFGLDVDAVVFGRDRWRRVLDAAPSWWGADPEWKHNLMALIPPSDADALLEAIGDLEAGIEVIEPGDGVLYQSTSIRRPGVITTTKLGSRPLSRRLTVRNRATATKLWALLDA